MKNLLAILLLFLFIGDYSAQTVFLNQPYEIGLIDKSNQRYVDVPIKNTSNKKVFIFRADADRRFQINYTSKEILPDSTVYMRVQFTPTIIGPFSEEVKVHFSCYTEPKTIRVTGFTEVVPNTTIACPSFSDQNINTSLNFELEVTVIDKNTREPIENAKVLMIKNGLVEQELLTNSRGFVEKEVVLGLYYFVVSAKFYYPKEFVKYVNRNNNVVLVELEKDPEAEQLALEMTKPDEVEKINDVTGVVVEDETVEKEPEKEIIQPEVIPEVIVEKEETIEITEVVEEVTEIIEDDPYPEFSLSKYKPSNIVFLVDVSSSMSYTGKLDLLKVAMIELTEMLREVDKITIVSYADNAKVILETMSGNNKDKIIDVIQGLKAAGYTAGGKGMKKAYEKAVAAYIKEGNNQVIMATDGGFNQGDINPYKLAEKYKKKGVTISIVGVKTKPIQELSLEKVVRYGDGHYVRIKNYEGAQNALIDELKTSSKRSK